MIKRLKRLKILVTGGLGAIGTLLTQKLREQGHEVWVGDLPHNEDSYYRRLDVANFREAQRFFEEKNFDFVYHLAAEFGRINGEDYYERVWQSNVIGTKNIIRLQEKYKFRMVFTSSSEIYGEWEDIMVEDVPTKYPIRQLNDYAISKWVNEMQIMNSRDRFDTETVILRLFNNYGPGEYYSPYRSVVCQFIYCALHDLPYTVYLNHHRTSSYINDTIQTMVNVIDNFKPGEVYNVAGIEYHDVKSLSDMILEYLGKTDKLVKYIPFEKHNAKDKKASIKKAIADLKHNPTIPLSAGIPKTIEWQKIVYKHG